jgi:chromosome segregation ATPase
VMDYADDLVDKVGNLQHSVDHFRETYRAIDRVAVEQKQDLAAEKERADTAEEQLAAVKEELATEKERTDAAVFEATRLRAALAEATRERDDARKSNKRKRMDEARNTLPVRSKAQAFAAVAELGAKEIVEQTEASEFPEKKKTRRKPMKTYVYPYVTTYTANIFH